MCVFVFVCVCRYIGNAGMHGHYAVVFAKLLIAEKDEGIALSFNRFLIPPSSFISGSYSYTYIVIACQDVLCVQFVVFLFS